MRIISGKARRILLQSPPGRDVRPTGDRVKESLFSMLEPLAGLRVLDLFAGTGALGLEAFSRGAERVVMLEREPRHAAVIRQNLAAVLKAMQEPADTERIRLVTGDAKNAPALLPELAGRFDLILADPPYNPPPGEYGAKELLQDPAFAAWAGSEALLVIEQDAETLLPWAPISPWRLVKVRPIGNTSLAFARLQ